MGDIRHHIATEISDASTTHATAKVNWPELLERVDHDSELLNDLTEIFLTDFPQRVQSLRHAVGQADSKQVMSVSHNLKGMLATLSATGASAAAAHLEQLGRHEQTAGFSEGLAKFETETAGLVAEISSHSPKAQP
ncbi:MAG TPA: Hpt domain-containing protein [Candidatus Acidoferrum sp.]|jgi:HPt (histidine-containing phosphotransfer) domain-containing protein